MFNKKTKAIVSIILAVCFIIVFIFASIMPFIASADTTQDKINSKQNEKNKIQEQIKEATQNKKELLGFKEQVDIKFNALQADINAVQKEIDDCNTRINDATVKINECEEKAEKQLDNMKTRLRVMYEDNNTSYITMLFGGDSLNDILSYIEIIKQILEHDNNIYEEIMATKKEIEELKISIEEEKEIVVAQKAELDSKKTELNAQRAEMQATMDAIQSDIESYKVAYEEAERAEAELKRQLARELGQSTTTASYTGGQLAWPTPGYATITSPYGYRIHPTLKVYKLHTGIDIGAPMGATVVAAEDGTVVKAQYNVAYGNYIVINHGNGYSTLYAHHSNNLVSEGDFVVRGQTIAKVGSTGYSTGPHSHFEVMINGQTTDPLPYIQ